MLLPRQQGDAYDFAAGADALGRTPGAGAAGGYDLHRFVKFMPVIKTFKNNFGNQVKRNQLRFVGMPTKH